VSSVCAAAAAETETACSYEPARRSTRRPVNQHIQHTSLDLHPPSTQPKQWAAATIPIDFSSHVSVITANCHLKRSSTRMAGGRWCKQQRPFKHKPHDDYDEHVDDSLPIASRADVL